MIIADNKLDDFIDRVGRTELYDELKKQNNNAWLYLKAVRATLIAVGFDNDWVEGKFRDALEHYYYDKKEKKPKKELNISDIIVDYSKTQGFKVQNDR